MLVCLCGCVFVLLYVSGLCARLIGCVVGCAVLVFCRSCTWLFVCVLLLACLCGCWLSGLVVHVFLGCFLFVVDCLCLHSCVIACLCICLFGWLYVC